MRDDPFFDTNILFYAYDLSEPIKRKFCRQIVGDVFSGRKSGVISNQVLVELYNALTRKLAVHVNAASVIVESFIESENWLKINYNDRTVMSALKSSLAFKSPFLDTLIAETMKDHGINRIMTENERDFGRIPGLKIINPIVQDV